MIRGALQGLTGTGKAAQNMLAVQQAKTQIERQKEIDKQMKKQRDAEIKLNEMKLEKLQYDIDREQQMDMQIDTAYKNYLKGFQQGGGAGMQQGVATEGVVADFLTQAPISRAVFEKVIGDPRAYTKEHRLQENQEMKKATFRKKQEDIAKKQKEDAEKVSFLKKTQDLLKQAKIYGMPDDTIINLQLFTEESLNKGFSMNVIENKLKTEIKRILQKNPDEKLGK